MAQRYRSPSALRHGAYSKTTLLPGEDPSDFDKLHDDIVAELTPNGAIEEDIVATIARLLWRKQNVHIYQRAEQARKRRSAIQAKLVPSMTLTTLDTRDPEEVRRAEKSADKQARRELGEAWELVEMGEVTTIDYLLHELAVIERLDAMIERSLKRLLLVRGVKSMESASFPVPPAAGLKQISAA
jgi:hypothetical protein